MRRARSVGLAVVVVLAALAGTLTFVWSAGPGGREETTADRLGPTGDAAARPAENGGEAGSERGTDVGGAAGSAGADRPGGDGLSAPDPGAAGGGAPGDPDDQERWVEDTLASLTLERRVGQMIMGYVFGTSASDRSPAAVAANQRTSGVDTAADAVARHGLGGVIYFDAGGTGPGALPDNIVAPDQTRALSAGLRAAADVPLLIAADQEQGTVLRVRDGVTLLPGQMAQGATGRPGDARAAAQITGADLRALGINVNFAPDADVNSDPANPVIGERSFGDDPAAVGRFTAAAVEGYRQVGVAAAAKHFPGHGATSVDSHIDLPVITRDRAQLAAVDLPPFRAAIAADVPMVMVGHLSVPALDRSVPATLSRPVIDGLLRRELGFDGVIVTDALNMAAITEHYTPGDAAVRAVRAGVDLLLMPPDLVQARDAVVAAVRSGVIEPGRVDASVRRVLRMKWRLEHDEPLQPRTPEAAGEAAVGIAEHAVTLLDQQACGVLPLAAAEAPVVDVVGPPTASRLLVEALTARGIRARTVAAGADGAPAADAAGPSATRVVLVGDSSPPAAGQRTIVVSTGTPYHAPSGAGAWLATYSRDPASMKALAGVLAGDVRPAGRLPVATRTADGTALGRGTGLTQPRQC